jgi:hypothetical protein
MPNKKNNSGKAASVGLTKTIQPSKKRKPIPSVDPPNYHVPEWSDWESCNLRLHAILGFNSDYNNLNNADNNKLLITLKEKNDVSTTFVNFFWMI